MYSQSGTSQPIDVGGAFNAGHLVGYCTMQACAALFGDIIQDSEANRQLGVARYPYASKLFISSSYSNLKYLKNVLHARTIKMRLPYKCV